MRVRSRHTGVVATRSPPGNPHRLTPLGGGPGGLTTRGGSVPALPRQTSPADQAAPTLRLLFTCRPTVAPPTTDSDRHHQRRAARAPCRPVRGGASTRWRGDARSRRRTGQTNPPTAIYARERQDDAPHEPVKPGGRPREPCRCSPRATVVSRLRPHTQLRAPRLTNARGPARLVPPLLNLDSATGSSARSSSAHVMRSS